MKVVIASVVLMQLCIAGVLGEAGDTGMACKDDGTCTTAGIVCDKTQDPDGAGVCSFAFGMACTVTDNKDYCYTGSMCDTTTTNKCQCRTTGWTNTGVSPAVLCTPTAGYAGGACLAESKCADDTETECKTSMCSCKSGYDRDYMTNKCTNGASGVVVSFAVMIAALFVTSRFL